MNFAVSCGGTGGHMFPGLAVAAVLRARGHRVAVILSGRAVEADRAKAYLPEGAEAMLVPVDPVSPRRPRSLVKLWRAWRTAKRELRAFRPDALLAMGSYTSIAPVLAARSLRVPVVLHEANAVPGSAVARLARFAATICTCFPDMARFFPKGAHLADTGLPLRAGFAKGVGGSKTDPSKFSLLVMGGSQGAQAVNRAVVETLRHLQTIERAEPELPKNLEMITLGGWNFGGSEDVDDTLSTVSDDRPSVPPFRVVHVAGKRNLADTETLYADAGLDPKRVEVEVVGFEHDMARRYAEANLCISRAGASSCFELALTGLPALFIPLPGLARDHQSRNAESLAARGAGMVFTQGTFQPEDLAQTLARLSVSPERLSELRENLLAAARPDAAERVADAVEAAARSHE